MEGCAIISKIDVETPKRLAGVDLVSLVRSRQVCEQLENRFEQISRLGWVVGGALLFRGCNVAHFGAALASVAGGLVCSERARSYGQLVETYREVEAWSAEPKQEVGPKIDAQELKTEVEKLAELVETTHSEWNAQREEDESSAKLDEAKLTVQLAMSYAGILEHAAALQEKLHAAAETHQLAPKVPARLACWKAHAAKGISPLW